MVDIELCDVLSPLLPPKKPGRPPLMGGARRIGVSLPSSTYHGLQAIVARDGRALSAYVRDVLVSHVDARTGSDDDLVDEDPAQPMSVQTWLDALDPPTEHDLELIRSMRSRCVSIRERIAQALETGSRVAPTIDWDAIPAPGGLLATAMTEDGALRHPIVNVDQLSIDLGEEG